jgi:hypothetical protein
MKPSPSRSKELRVRIAILDKEEEKNFFEERKRSLRKFLPSYLQTFNPIANCFVPGNEF